MGSGGHTGPIRVVCVCASAKRLTRLGDLFVAKRMYSWRTAMGNVREHMGNTVSLFGDHNSIILLLLECCIPLILQFFTFQSLFISFFEIILKCKMSLSI